MHKTLRVKDVAISDGGFVFDPFSGGTFTLNTTGQFIVKALRDGLTPEEVAIRLQKEFRGATHKAEEDVQDFLRALREFGLLLDADETCSG